MTQRVVIGDAASLGRNIVPDDYAIGWKTTGLPADAVSLDTWRDLFETRLRAILTAIITTDAPSGLTLSDLTFDGPITLRLEYMVGGNNAHLDLDLSHLFPTTGEPSPIGPSGSLGTEHAMPHSDHGHRLPSRANAGETPVVGLNQIANALSTGFGMRLGFSSADGTPEYVAEVEGADLGTDNPQPVGGAAMPGTDPAGSHQDHGHPILARSVGLAELAVAPAVSDRGKAIGFDPATGEPTTLEAGGGTFLSQTDTPATYGTQGQVPQVNPALDGLVFAGPFQPLLAPAPPTNLRTTDAFDMALENHWTASPDAVSYEWQRKAPAGSWPAGDGTSVAATFVRVTALALGTYDFRVRSVGHGGMLKSSWVEVAGIPLIATPTPATSQSNTLSRVRSQTLRFRWDNLDVDNGGVGAARVNKAARYDFQYREAGQQSWGNLVGHNDTINVDVDGLTNGTIYEMRVMGTVRRSDGSMTALAGLWSGASNQEKPVKDTVTLTYGVAATRTGAITAPRDIEAPFTGGVTFEITNAANPVTAGQFYALDLARGDEYAHDYNLQALETRPLATDITAGSNYMAEANPGSGPRRYSVGPSTAIDRTQVWYIEVA